MLSRTKGPFACHATWSFDAVVASTENSQRNSTGDRIPRGARWSRKAQLAMGLMLPLFAMCGYGQSTPARLFVGNTADGTVSVLDATAFFSVATISLGSACGPRGMAQSADLQYVY